MCEILVALRSIWPSDPGVLASEGGGVPLVVGGCCGAKPQSPEPNQRSFLIGDARRLQQSCQFEASLGLGTHELLTEAAASRNVGLTRRLTSRGYGANRTQKR